MDHSVLIVHKNPELYSAMLEERFPSCRFHYATSSPEVGPALEAHQPEVVFSIKESTFPGCDHQPAVECPSVKWVCVGGSGYEHMLPWNPDRLVVTNCEGVLSRYLAETVIGGLLTLNAGFISYLNDKRQRAWRPRPFRPLCEQTLLVVGLGHIGGWVATYAKNLGLQVLGVRGSTTLHDAVDELFQPAALGEIIGRADAVSLHVRLTDRTRRLIDRSMLAAMKPGALLLNTSRGGVIDEAALVEALAQGQVGGAYLDVFETEPLPQDSPLWELPNVLITPHTSDNVVGWPKKLAGSFTENLERWLNGETPLNRVNP